MSISPQTPLGLLLLMCRLILGRESTLNIPEMNHALQFLYSSCFDDIVKLRQQFSDLNWPHFIHVPKSYAKSAIPLMVVGQQTAGWGKGAFSSVEDIVNEYKHFDLGANYRSTPFWAAAGKLHKQLNPDADDNGYIWSNLNKLAQRKKRPTSVVESAAAKYCLLESEIRICKPQVVVFFTGPRYDEILKLNFANLKPEPLSKTITKIIHPSLPDHSYRTFHPKYLRMSKQWNVLDEIVALVKCNKN